MWSLFPTRRELKRLATDCKFWRSRCSALEKKVETLNALLLERDFAWSDRFLTSQVKTFAINDETQAKVFQKQKEDFTERNLFLESRRREIYEDAKEAGVSEAEADRRFHQIESDLIENWQTANNFG